MENAYDKIRANQLEWAKSQGITTDAGYTLNIKDNLFVPLSEASTSEFSSGRGGEFGELGTRGKIQALHSSAALVVNFFEYWRSQKNIQPLVEACGATDKLTEMHFEVTHKNPAGRIRPHLDVEFTGIKGSKPLAIESKFTEPYSRHTRRTLSPSYINKKGIWKGLPGCEALANQLAEENGKRTSYEYFDAPQLLKHILGLTTDCGPKGFQLLYLWYGVASSETLGHWDEIVEFERRIKDEVNFIVMTYQDLFAKVSQIKNTKQEYLDYLRQRYFTEKYNSVRDKLLAYEYEYGCPAGDIDKIKLKRSLTNRKENG